MVVGGINKRTSTRESGIPWVSNTFSLSVENEQADAGRNGRTRLARPNLRRANGDREIFIFPVHQLITSRIGNLTRLIHTLLYVMTIHPSIHISPNKSLNRRLCCFNDAVKQQTFIMHRR